MKWPFHESHDRTPETALHLAMDAIAQVSGNAWGTVESPIPPQAFLGADLGLSSLAVARLAGILNQHGGTKPLPFHKLFVSPEGSLRHDVRVSDLAAFLEQHRNTPRL